MTNSQQIYLGLGMGPNNIVSHNIRLTDTVSFEWCRVL